MCEGEPPANPGTRIGDKVVLEEYPEASPNWSQHALGNHRPVLDANDRAKGGDIAGIDGRPQWCESISLKQKLVYLARNEPFVKHSFSPWAVFAREVFEKHPQFRLA